MREKRTGCWFVYAIISKLFFTGLLAGFASCEPAWDIHNPYSSVDWDRYQQYKANFHTHTNMSDGRLDPAKVIDLYHSLEYDILSITDHDSRGPGNDPDHPEMHITTWPWQHFDRDPAALNMLAIEGNEVGIPHIVSLFNDYGNAKAYADESLSEIGRRGGLAIMAHPGNYMADNWARPLSEHYEIWRDETMPIAWYVDLFFRYDHLLGVEILCKGEGCNVDRDIWDAILTEMADKRSVWGFSNDDMHNPDRQKGNWNIMLLPELSEEATRKALEKGMFFFVSTPDGPKGPAPPEIRAIEVNPLKGTIHIEAYGHKVVNWISEGKIVHRGDKINLSEPDELGGYVRAMIHATNSATVIGTQPFRILTPGKQGR